MIRTITLLILVLPSIAIAGWQHNDKKTADETVAILTSNDEVMNAYLWLPADYDPNNHYSAVVMAHGCGGAHYRDSAHQWTAQYVSGKYKVWGNLLNQQNMIALLVDSFTHRDNNGDVGGGVCGGDPLNRPSKIDPVSVRPADIAEGIAWLKTRDDINPDKIGVLGFSNGGTASLVLANHAMMAANQEQLIIEGKEWFDLPHEAQYQALTVVSLYPGCGLNGYSEATQNLFTDSFETNSETYLFAASNDNSLPDNSLEKCHGLTAMDVAKGWQTTNLQMQVIENTSHQFDYYENDEPAVQQAISRILALFSSM